MHTSYYIVQVVIVHLWSPVKADSVSSSPLIVVDVQRLQHSVNGQIVNREFHTAGRIGPGVVDLNTQSFLIVHTQALIITLLTCGIYRAKVWLLIMYSKS